MALIKWDPFREVDRFFDDDFFPMLGREMKRVGWDLAVDVYEDDGNVVVEANVPGIDPEDVDVEVEDNIVSISGSREETKEEKEKNYTRKEIKRGSFKRVVRLPADVKSDEAQAEYEDGVLKITIPREKKKTEGKKIAIKKK